MSIGDDALNLSAQLAGRLEQVTDRQTRDIVAAYARGWDEVAGDLEQALTDLAADAGDGRITRAAINRSTRLTKALGHIATRLAELADSAGVLIVGDLDAVVRDAAATQQAIVAAQLPAGAPGLAVTFDRADTRALDAIVKRSTEQITALTRPISADATAAIRRELVRGLAAGSNPRDTARRMLARTQGTFEGGAARALTIARTETLDAFRNGAMAAQQANADLLAGWVWLADLGARTCPACWAMHGSEHPLSEPGPLGHQNCRCARMPKAKSWRDLGIDLDEPPSVLPDAGRAFGSLDAGDQRAVLGPARYAAWQAGDLPMDRWAVRRSTDGWRDSYVPVKPPSGGRSARLAS